jgi:hypothetical protein
VRLGNLHDSRANRCCAPQLTHIINLAG